jgi:hypothetical protein
LQNQAIKNFSVYGSRLLELEVEVAQIQLFVRISLHHLLSVDQQDLVLGGFLFLSFGPLPDSSLLFLFVLDFRTFLSVDFIYTLFTLVLLKHQGRVFYYCGLSILCLPFVLL